MYIVCPYYVNIIRPPRPWPRQGRRLGPPQVWNFSFLVHPAANRHPKATHQWLLMGVQASRLPALKRLKPLKTFKTLKTLKTLTTRHGGPSLPFAMLHPASNRHPKATHQWLLMGVQACRLPALKRLKPLKTLKRLKNPQKA